MIFTSTITFAASSPLKWCSKSGVRTKMYVNKKWGTLGHYTCEVWKFCKATNAPIGEGLRRLRSNPSRHSLSPPWSTILVTRNIDFLPWALAVNFFSHYTWPTRTLPLKKKGILRAPTKSTKKNNANAIEWCNNRRLVFGKLIPHYISLIRR